MLVENICTLHRLVVVAVVDLIFLAGQYIQPPSGRQRERERTIRLVHCMMHIKIGDFAPANSSRESPSK